MTLEEARALAAEIDANERDIEARHGLQDELMEAAIDAVLAGHPDAIPICAIAKQAWIKHDYRWYA